MIYATYYKQKRWLMENIYFVSWAPINYIPVPSPHFFGIPLVVLGLPQICIMGNISKWLSCKLSCLCCENIICIGQVSRERFSYRIRKSTGCFETAAETFCGARSTFGALLHMIKKKNYFANLLMKCSRWQQCTMETWPSAYLRITLSTQTSPFLTLTAWP